MNILLINGSPKGERSNTLKLSMAFCEGLKAHTDSHVEVIHLSKLNIKPCLGCFSCWSKTPGKCVIKDDMEGLLQKLITCDIIIWSFPLYYFSLPSTLKMMIDRQLPTCLPFMTNDSNGGHPSRYDLSHQKYVVISTCGFYTPKGNYDSVNLQFDRLYGKGRYLSIYCGEGELFRVPELKKRTDEYLSFIRKAGEEFVNDKISSSTLEEISKPLYPREIFEKWADDSWGIDHDTNEKLDDSFIFTKQMAALYNLSSWKNSDKVVEFHYTDIDKSYQIILKKDGFEVLKENFVPYTTLIETPLQVWKKIAMGEISGPQAMMEKLYIVKGNFDLMLHWDEYFGDGSAKSEEPSNIKVKKTNMLVMLIPWMAFWIGLPIDTRIGSFIVIAISGLIPLSSLFYKLTIFEGITSALVVGLSSWALLGGRVDIIVSLSYLLFGLMWFITTFLKMPLSAYYSSNNYGGESAKDNPLFVSTNRILTLCWGILYLFTFIWTYFLLQTSISSYVGAINSLAPIIMGIFTMWFQKWYPKHYASKK